MGAMVTNVTTVPKQPTSRIGCGIGCLFRIIWEYSLLFPTYLGFHNFKMVLAYSSYSKLAFDVSTNNMTVRFEIC